MVTTCPTQFQSLSNGSGTKFVCVDGKIYHAKNPKSYIASVKRNATHNVVVYECDQVGMKI